MPQLTVEGRGTFKVPQGKRLVLALEDEAHASPLHSCGGNARCTSCRVKFVAGEPEQMTVAEKKALEIGGLTGVRLSCQILCEQDMTVRGIGQFQGGGEQDTATRPTPELRPLPVEWTQR